MKRTLITALCWGLAAAPAPGQPEGAPKQSPLATADAGEQIPATAPWQRLLTGEDAKRVADLEAKARELEEGGSLPEAVAVAREVLEIRTRRQGADHWQTVDAQWQLKTLRQIEGLPAADQKAWAASFQWQRHATELQLKARYSEAQPLYQKILALRVRLLGKEHPQTAVSYNNQAANLYDQGRYAQAQPLYQLALDLRRKLLGEDHPDTAASYNNLALNLQAQAQYAQAQPLYQKALDINRRLLGEDHFQTAISYNNLAYNLNAQGRYPEAQPLYEKALDLSRKLLGDDHPKTAQSYHALADNLHAQGRYAEAERFLLTAARNYTQARRRASLSGLVRANITGLPSPLPLLAGVLARNGKPDQAWTHLEEDLGRGLLDNLAARQLAAQHLTPQERRRQEDLLATLQRQEKLFQQPPRNADNPEAPTRWAELMQRYQEAQTALSQFRAEMAHKYGVATGQAYDLARIQAQLPADAALLTWVDIPGEAQAADPNGEHWACLVRAQGKPAWVRLSGSGTDGAWTKADDELPHRLRQALANHQDDSPELARKLSAQRLAPLEKHLGPAGPLPAVRHLVVLPVRWMAGVPVEALTDRYVISYAPSGTLFAKLREQHPAAEQTQSPPRLLALGDPVFAPPVAEAKPAPKPPDHGVLLAQVPRGSNAERAGLKPGDVLLSYAGSKLADPDALRQAISQHSPKPDGLTRGDKTVALKVWREGQTLELTAAPGPLGVVPANGSAAAAIQSRHEADALLRGLRGALRPLPGSQAEVQAIAGLFPQAETLLGSDASEQRLDELAAGRPRAFRYLHFATHGLMNDGIPLQSSLALAQDHLPDPLAQVLAGKKAYDGRLTADQILQSWKLDADLVTLSACETGLGRQGGGDGYIGFAQVLFLAGARSLVLSLWEVDDRATALLMLRFYQNLLGTREGLAKPLPKAEALAEAKRWLRDLSREEAERLVKDLPTGKRVGKIKEPGPVVPAAARPFAHPYYWSAFILIGDPQ